MNKSILFLLLLAFTTISNATIAHAETPRSKPWHLGWLEHRENLVAVTPNKSGSKHYHPDQWRDIPAGVSYKQRDAIITDAKEDGFIDSIMASDNIATVYTGPLFKELAFPDKQFLLRVIGTHFDILNSKYELFTIRDAKTRNFIGTYSRNGLEIE